MSDKGTRAVGLLTWLLRRKTEHRPDPVFTESQSEPREVGTCAYCRGPVLYRPRDGGVCPCGQTRISPEFVRGRP